MRPVAISLSPNAEKKDIFQAWKLLFSPRVYFQDTNLKQFEQWFRTYFGVSYAISFNSGRSALFILLKALNIQKNDEVILQAFTCSVVPYMVLKTGAKPVYVDCNEILTMDVDELEKKISPRTKAIIVQHTFGIPANLNDITTLAKKHSIYVIEDCAHNIGGNYSGKKLGLFGDASIFSFGRDKAFSSVFGGMVITKDAFLGKKIRSLQKQLQKPSFYWTIQQLFHPIAFFFILPLYNIVSIGKILLILFQKLSLLSFPVVQDEKIGTSKYFNVKKMSNALACLAVLQLERLEQFNKKRELFVAYYLQELKDVKEIELPFNKSTCLLRFPIFVRNRDKIYDRFKSNNIYLGKWYSEVIDPKGTRVESFFYQKGMCPQAEKAANSILNLPTYPTMNMKDAQRIVVLLKKYVTSS